MKSIFKTISFFTVCTFLLLQIPALPEIEARPGGGSSYRSSSGSSRSSSSGSRSSSSRSSGSSSSSGGSSGSSSYSSSSDGDNLIWLLVQLIFAYPAIGIPAIVLIAIAFFVANRNKPNKVIASNSGMQQVSMPDRGPTLSVAENIDEVIESYKTKDPEFSRVVLVDFVSLLYHQVHENRASQSIKNLKPFMEPALLSGLASPSQTPVSVDEIVIGAIHLENIQSEAEFDYIQLYIEANYSEFASLTEKKNGKRFIVEERWKLRRKSGLLSGNPDKMQELSCPNCGSGLSLDEFGACKYCKTSVAPGTMQWELYNIKQILKEESPDWSFGTQVEEQGTERPTIFSNSLNEEKAAFASRNQLPDFSSFEQTFSEKIVRPIFKNVYDSWSTRNWMKARPVMSDRLFDSHYYWIKEYEQKNAWNKLDNLNLKKIEVVRIESDKYYEAITARLHASVLDYVEDGSGQLLGGSKTKPRDFTEYWTFIRRAGATKKEDDFNADQCPNCGAPIKMGMTGVCEYCKSKVTTGNFNWVLGTITQDEIYG